MLDTLWTFDRQYDLSGWHALVSVVTSFMMLWLMVCRTRGADFVSVRGVLLWGQRALMAVLAAFLFASAATPLYNDQQPWAADVVVRTCFLILLLVFALRLRFDIEARR